MEEKWNNIKGISEETANELSKRMLALANQVPFVTEELKRQYNGLVSLIWQELEMRHIDMMMDYNKWRLIYMFSKWPFRWYCLMRARKALVKYRSAFHDCERFKREFKYEEFE